MLDNQKSYDLICEILSFTKSSNALNEKLNKLSDEDWERILHVTTKQGVPLVLFDRLRKLDDTVRIPQFAQARLLETYHRSLAKNMRMMHHAKLILNLLRNHHIDVIALKGIYLVESIYGNIGLRTFFDLDLMVRKIDLHHAMAVMKDDGYVLSTYYDMEDDNQDIKHIPAIKKGKGPYVELHWGLLEENVPFEIDLSGVWQRAIPVNVCGEDVLALSNEDLILHLCIHFTYQHHMDIGLKALYDIALVIQKCQNQINWNRIVSISKLWGVEKVIWLTFSLLGRILNVYIPKAVLKNLLPRDTQHHILALAINQLKTYAHIEEKIDVTPDLVNLYSRKNLFVKIKLTLNRVFIPKRIMARAYNLSPSSIKIYFYYFIRFKELLIHYAPTILKISQKDEEALATVKSEQIKGELIDWYRNR